MPGIRANSDWSKFCRLGLGAASPFTLQEQFDDATPNGSILTDSSVFRLGTRFVPGSSYTLVKAAPKLLRTGSLTGITINVTIHNESAGLPGAQIGTASTTFNVDDVVPTGTHAFVEFPGLSAALTSGTPYWMCVNNSAPFAVFGVWWLFSDLAGGTLGRYTGTWAAALPDNKCLYRTYS